jgi:hypothetical protein
MNKPSIRIYRDFDPEINEWVRRYNAKLIPIHPKNWGWRIIFANEQDRVAFKLKFNR